MTICLGVCKETTASEKRVSLIPSLIPRFVALGCQVCVESEAGIFAGFPDTHYEAQDHCHLVSTQQALLEKTDIFFTLHPLHENEVSQLKPNTVLIGQLFPFQHPQMVKLLAEKKVTSFALELIPRITRAQSMDILSSQATCAGYQAALVAASLSSRFLPMLTTAAGTIRPAKVLIIGVGVAGLQAIATAKRLGAIVEAYDVRSATKEQAESLGARFIQLSTSAEGQGGYARELTAEEKINQQNELAGYLHKADIIICTAAVPGKKAPLIVTREMIEGMHPGTVIVDIAAEMGGNTELTQADKLVFHHGVKIYGAINLASEVATHASEMFCKNLLNFMPLIIKDQRIQIDWDDEIIKASVITHEGHIHNIN